MQCIFNLDLAETPVKCQGYMSETVFAGHLAVHMEYLENNPDTYAKIMKEVVIE